MNVDKDIRDELIELIKKSINHYNSFKHYEWVKKPAIPILFFGNIVEYLNSDIKMITVALNPSDEEFPKDKPRFSFCPDKLNKNDAIKVLDTLNEYFKFNPYDDWFNKFTEKIMNKMNISYYSNKGFINRALNTDLCTPIATNPTWDGLVNNKKTKISNDLSDELKKQGFKIWIELIKILKPNVILISLAKDYLTSNNFVEKTILKNNENIGTDQKDTLKVNYRRGDWGASLSALRVGELFDNGVKSDDGQVYVIPSMTTANVSVYKKLTLNGNDARLRLMIRNIADERAPLADGFFGFYSDIHRDEGRHYYLDLRMDF